MKTSQKEITDLWYKLYRKYKGIDPIYIKSGRGNYPKTFQKLSELNLSLEQFEKAMTNGFEDKFISNRMEAIYLLENINILLTLIPNKKIDINNTLKEQSARLNKDFIL